MAVMQHSIIFGGVDSADFDLYIGGEGTFNAPKRAVDLVEVPGRNGAVAIDQGYFENIELSYTAINQEADLDTFSQKLGEFRNAICSKRGYQRLTDTFHPNEYRMALFVDKMDIKPIDYATASKFEITFNCKPQRFLTSGEDPVSVSSGDSIVNPTLFEAQPILSLQGYGGLTIGNQPINVFNRDLGDIELFPAFTAVNKAAGTGEPSTVLCFENRFMRGILNTDDVITTGKTIYKFYPSTNVGDVEIVSSSGISGVTVSSSGTRAVIIEIPSVTLGFLSPSGANPPKTRSLALTLKIWVDPSVSYTATINIDITNRWFTSSGQAIGQVYTVAYLTLPTGYSFDQWEITTGACTAYSTTSPASPINIDCETGEAYTMSGDAYVSANNLVSLGADLPVLGTGSNTITFDNTFYDVQITPRWWQI